MCRSIPKISFLSHLNKLKYCLSLTLFSVFVSLTLIGKKNVLFPFKLSKYASIVAVPPVVKLDISNTDQQELGTAALITGAVIKVNTEGLDIQRKNKPI